MSLKNLSHAYRTVINILQFFLLIMSFFLFTGKLKIGLPKSYRDLHYCTRILLAMQMVCYELKYYTTPYIANIEVNYGIFGWSLIPISWSTGVMRIYMQEVYQNREKVLSFVSQY